MTLEEARAKLNLEEFILPVGASNRPGSRIRPTHITIHNTDNSSAGADARFHGRYLRSADARSREVSWHYSVDDQRCVKHLPHNEMGWHAGRGNKVSVAIEICQHRGVDQNAAIERAALLTAVLMHELGIADKSKVVQHNAWTGKDCPSVIRHRFQGGFARFVEMTEGFRRQITTGGGGFVASVDSRTEAEDAADFTAGLGGGDEDEAVLLEGFDGVSDGDDEVAEAPQRTDRVALLERLLGQKEAELAELREALREAKSLLNEGP
jgi:N-acetylmuramoyl-L-alanine amidase